MILAFSSPTARGGGFLLKVISGDWGVVVQSQSHVQLFITPWTEACQASLSFTIFHSLLKLMSIELVMSSNHLILCHFLLLLPSVFASIRVFSNELALHIMWPKYWSFSIRPSNEYSGLISFRMVWFDLLAVHGTLKSLLQHHSWKASILTSPHVQYQTRWSHMPITATVSTACGWDVGLRDSSLSIIIKGPTLPKVNVLCCGCGRWGRAGGSWIRDRQAQYPGRITLHADPMDPGRNLNSQ